MRNLFVVKYFCPLEPPMNKKHYFLFIVKGISYVQFSSCHTSNENFLAMNFSQTTVCLICDITIIKSSDDVLGDDAVYCEGDCKGWLH